MISLKKAGSVGIFLVIVGITLIISGFFISSFTKIPLIYAGFSLVFTGGIFIFLNRLFEKFPDSIKNYDMSIKGINKRISSATEMLKHQNNIERLSSIGIPIKIKILNLKDTETLVNYDSIIDFQLEVLKEHSYFYNNYFINSHKQIVPKIILSRLKIGDVYHAKLDPEDKNNMYIDFTL